jgi:hypothetical protein
MCHTQVIHVEKVRTIQYCLRIADQKKVEGIRLILARHLLQQRLEIYRWIRVGMRK